MNKLSTKYHFDFTEKPENYSYWKEIIAKSNNFSASLLMPPPNITGNLHLGHCLDLIPQDFLVRYFYLKGQLIYWISGIDHAGIATQKKIESLNISNLQTTEQKKNYTLNTWYPQTKKVFFQQWEKLGLFVNYENVKFTLDSNIQDQVKQAFIQLYNDGLIYRDKKLVNWDPQLKSVISDIEVEHKPSESKLYYLKYPLLNSDDNPQTNQEKNTNYEISFVRVIIQNKEGKILMLKEKKWGWIFPGGKIEEGETPLQAAKREVFEETNLVVEKLKKVKERIFLSDDLWIKTKQQTKQLKGYAYWTNEYSGEVKIKEPEKTLDIKFMDKTSQGAVLCAQWWFFSSNKSDYLKMLNGEEEKPENSYLLVATSRPETVFADVALFVNPQDQRYQKYIGQEVQHPVTKKIIPVLADEKIIIDFGTGVLKCTPGHDFFDYELGKKYNLPLISCYDKKGNLNELAGKWQGQKPQSIRQELVKELQEKNICLKVETYQTNLAVSQRTGVPVEPLLSTQWFCDLPQLIKKIEAKNPDFLSKINFYPSRFQQVIKEWKEKTHEWCISRQLWWGHQIPVWYHKKTGEIYVGENSPSSVNEWEPEKDVLDTWFSSGLWPLTIINQGQKFPFPNPQYFPITHLVTGYDILFFWVLKMILLSYYFTNQPSFQNVYLHGLIRDSQGRKMSKSLGNGVEPEEIIEKYGTDSLRLFLLENNILGSDLIFEESKIKGAYNFIQKLWSIGNFLLLKLEEKELKIIEITELETELNKENNKELKIINTWILTELEKLKKAYFKHSEKLETSLLAKKLIDFTWQKLSNDYLELIKITTWSLATKKTLLYVYQQILAYFYPFIPFVTEYLYKKVSGQKLLV
ncbi:class I tRNA ligase family protein [endosymbiont GvMRE of Glomus versiforme]|uniref:class I tRNA ligase family protein n=1 Tax=endosymbiont GvMRE of Glomus versiforme TaxID=2039283 RepID=UPI000EEFB5DE|nr:class I tRNA ligase family protein [endosymbiont GvMRE of Glomus versiforme]RHZ36398.1 Valine--tRNA ligase [endosymbiont GvMRE of Glomus versiforme]